MSRDPSGPLAFARSQIATGNTAPEVSASGTTASPARQAARRTATDARPLRASCSMR